MTTYNYNEIFEDIPGDPDNVLVKIPPQDLAFMDWREGDIVEARSEDGSLVLSNTSKLKRDSEQVRYHYNYITLNEFLEASGYKISGGGKYGWACYGFNAYFIDCANEDLKCTSSIIFDTKTQEVFEVGVWDELNSKDYEWRNPSHIDSYMKEFSQRGQSAYIGKDAPIELDLSEDMLEKLTAIFKGLPYDERIMISLDLDDDTRKGLETMALEQNITMDRLVEKILQEFIENKQIDLPF